MDAVIVASAWILNPRAKRRRQSMQQHQPMAEMEVGTGLEDSSQLREATVPITEPAGFNSNSSRTTESIIQAGPGATSIIP